ncbi:death-associated protein 1-like [Panonychus citri]|uniref:death-associated protein 1-like n=1 Tax=Panonychus citri TaxID=50023 RepID=UPI002307517D|nr:death-associated protein 1-like [Panonychus citri]
MSSPEETSNLKAGHPPAVKVGGMRITQHKPEKPKEEKETRPVDEEAEEETGIPISESPPKTQNIVISGAVARGDADFPPEAIKAFHEKPTAAHDYRPSHPKNHTIQQPRK